MKKIISIVLIIATLSTLLTACGKNTSQTYDGVQITLSDKEILVDKKTATDDKTQAVYVANDIVYYEHGHDFTYGEGEESDAHTKKEAESHKVVHITKAGQYVINGNLSAGQIAVDLGEDAKKDKNAVVTLVLNGVDINCTVAPAVIFYNVYECGDKDTENATKDVDTSEAGANVIIADNTTNNISGSYVARIYEPGTVVLNEDGTEVEDAEKLHKYDGAFYSKRSMNIDGGEKDNGILNINAENEGLDSELHLTINGGNINIVSGNDGINTNEDGVSVTTINGGSLNIMVDGATGEGDGIDSNGWLVINGGSVTAEACATSGDAGIDSDMGIHINGGYVFASGNMLDRISESTQNYAVFEFSANQKSGTYTLKNAKNKTASEKEIQNDFKYLIISDSTLNTGDYTLWQGKNQFAGIKANTGGGFIGGMRPGDMGEDMTPPEDFGGQPPEGFNGQKPEEFEGERPEMPEGEVPQKPEGEMPERPENMPDDMTPPEDFGDMPDRGERPDTPQENQTNELSTTFKITDGGNNFMMVTVS